MRLVALAVLLVGCGGAEASGRDDGTRTLTLSEPILGDGVSRVEATCFAEERCDTLDSDCDGRIDEGCAGVRGGALQLGLAWSGHANLRLEVTPTTEAGEETNEETVDGCEDLGPHLVRRVASEIAEGEVRVAVVRGDACEDDGPTTASVTIAAEGRTLGTFNVVVTDERVEVVRFSLTR